MMAGPLDFLTQQRPYLGNLSLAEMLSIPAATFGGSLAQRGGRIGGPLGLGLASLGGIGDILAQRQQQTSQGKATAQVIRALGQSGKMPPEIAEQVAQQAEQGASDTVINKILEPYLQKQQQGPFWKMQTPGGKPFAYNPATQTLPSNAQYYQPPKEPKEPTFEEQGYQQAKQNEPGLTIEQYRNRQKREGAEITAQFRPEREPPRPTLVPMADGTMGRYDEATDSIVPLKGTSSSRKGPDKGKVGKPDFPKEIKDNYIIAPSSELPGAYELTPKEGASRGGFMGIGATKLTKKRLYYNGNTYKAGDTVPGIGVWNP